MSQAADQNAVCAGDAFTLCWCHRLFRGYGIWIFANLLFYVVFLMMVCKGTFPGGFRGLMMIFMQAVMISGGLQLGLSCCSAFALSGMWRRFFPGQSAMVHWLWYLSIPLPFLQVWGYLSIVWKELQNRRIWLVLLVLGTVGIVLSSVVVLGSPSAERWNYLGWVAVSWEVVLLVQARLFWVLGRIQYGRMRFRLMMSIGGLTAFAVLAPLFLMNQAERRIAWVRAQLEQLGVPGEVAAAKKAYFQGVEPDADWSRLAELLSHSALSENFERLTAPDLEQMNDDCPEVVSAAYMLALHNAFVLGTPGTSELVRQYSEDRPEVCWLNRLVDQTKLLRCRRNYDSESISLLAYPDLKISRSCARFFAVRGRAAVRQGKYELAEAYWNRCCRLADQLTSFPDGMLSARGGGIAVELIGLNLAKEIVVSGKLNTEALERWQKNLASRQKKYISWVVMAMKGEPVCMLDLAQRGMPEFRQYRYHNWGGAPMFCYIQNDLFTGLNIQAFILRDIMQPSWRPGSENAFRGNGFKALNYLNGMTFTSMFLSTEIKNFLELGEVLSCHADLTVLAAEIEIFRLKQGRLPRNLGELAAPLPMDPFSSRNYFYKTALSRKGYVLWGIGLNRLDDGGTPDKDIVLTTVSED